MEPRLVFFGTPAVAAHTLRKLAKTYDVIGVITEPDKPAGRGQKLSPTPVALAADELKIPLYKPATKDDIAPIVKKLKPTVGVLVAYGKIIPEEILTLIPSGILNIHGSLLPHYRGAAPLQRAILAGEKETGATIMQLDAGVDTGPIISQVTVPIETTDTTESLGEKVVAAGTTELIKVIPGYLNDQLIPQPQPKEGSLAPKISKGDGQIDWSNDPIQIERQVRAYTPWPRSFTTWRDRPLIIHKAKIVDNQLIPEVIQLAGKQPATWSDFLNGFHLTQEEALMELARG